MGGQNSKDGGETSSLGRRSYVFTDSEIKRVTRIAE